MKRDDVTRVFFECQRRDALNALTRQEMSERVHSLARDDVSEHEIARITRLHVDQVRKMLGEFKPQSATESADRARSQKRHD
jgi:hypothetical protein